VRVRRLGALGVPVADRAVSECVCDRDGDALNDCDGKRDSDRGGESLVLPLRALEWVGEVELVRESDGECVSCLTVKVLVLLRFAEAE